MSNEIKIIETEIVKADYDIDCTIAIIETTIAIIETEKEGRLYIREGFGGLDTIEGGAVRWRHGMVVKIGKKDTLESLKSKNWNDGMSYYTAMLGGYYGEILNWSGAQIESLAKSAKIA